MSTRITSSFDVRSWDDSPYHEPEDGPRLARASVRKVYRGALEGESTAELLMCQVDPADHRAGAGYVASERFVGSLGERSGTFVLQHGGISGPGEGERTFGHIVPGSGTGELAALRGTAEIERDGEGNHTLTLDHSFEQGER